MPGVHRPCSDTWLLAETLRREPLEGRLAADLCTGSGILALVAAQHGARRALAVDVSLRATLATRFNARLNGCDVETRHGDLLEALGRERFDVITCNPPYVPSATDALPRHRSTTPLDGGRDGRAILDRVCAAAPRHLRRRGLLLLVQSSVCGVEQTCERLRTSGLSTEVLARAPGGLGPVLRSRAPLLRERGLLGEREEEELVVVGARAG